MFLFLIPLVLGFAFNLASAFTTAFSRRWGERRGSFVTAILRDLLGIPVWAIGFVLAIRTPSLTLIVSTMFTEVVGWITIGAGGAIIVVALVMIRLRAAVPSTGDPLVHNGIYAYVRHPIHTGTLLEFTGLFFIRPTLAVASACALGVVWVLLQTRFEELDLMQRMPSYREYMNRVPRFLPRLQKRRSTS
jgi:protein-S-isoprenylcysteine O-methyltransferase Ste14